MVDKVAIRAINRGKTRVINIPVATHARIMESTLASVERHGCDAVIKREIDFDIRRADKSRDYLYSVEYTEKKHPYPEISLEPEIQYP